MKSLLGRLVVGFFLLSFVGGCGCSNKDILDDTITPVETLFEKLVGEPLSVTASNLQGGGHTWQGYSVYLRFVPSAHFENKLRRQGYVEVPFHDVDYSLQLEERL